MGYIKDRSIASIAETAAEWFVAMRVVATSAEQRLCFAAWLAESPVHVREYLGIVETWGALKAGQSWPKASVEELIALAREVPQVFELASDIANSRNAGGASMWPPRAADPRIRAPFKQIRVWAVAASVLLLVAILPLTLSSLIARGTNEYSTARGEQRSIALGDGSIVQLNTLSRLIVRFDGRTRRVELPEGEAFFRVAHDASRPFLVVTPVSAVRAIGTEFNVYSRERETEVVVLTGRVGVSIDVSSSLKLLRRASDAKNDVAPNSHAAIILGARDSIVLAHGRASRAAARRPEEALSWMQRRLVFDNESAAYVVKEFNLYNTRQLQVSDPRLSVLRISGVFDTDDPGALVKYLGRVHGIYVLGGAPMQPREPQSRFVSP